MNGPDGTGNLGPGLMDIVAQFANGDEVDQIKES